MNTSAFIRRVFGLLQTNNTSPPALLKTIFVARYHNEVLKYYQEKQRYVNSKLQDPNSETADRRSLKYDTASLKDDDAASLRDCLVECKSPPLNRPAYNRRYDDDCKSIRSLRFPKNDYEEDAKSLTLTIRDAMLRKRNEIDIYHVPERIQMTRKDESKSLNISLSSYKCQRADKNAKVDKADKPVQTEKPARCEGTFKYDSKPKKMSGAINKEIFKALKRKKKKKEDLYQSLKARTSLKKRDPDLDSLAMSLDGRSMRYAPMKSEQPEKKEGRATKQKMHKQQQSPMLHYQPASSIYSIKKQNESSRAKERQKEVLPWAKNKLYKAPEHVMQKNVSNVAHKRLHSKNKDSEKAQAAMAPATPQNFITKIMNMYRNKKIH
ncbi:uncharacterized protein LOC126265965 [Aethina tumida]|uniref:uncharacterized protein LOC126265965 n=1 Tax=Aethina tumida TaxID=116153 RepID=UPI002147B5A7|nr:uncharacterized protein LOC126265965 [Aethina tumida]